MRTMGLAAVLALAACAGPSAGQDGNAAATAAAVRKGSRPSAPQDESPASVLPGSMGGAFAGAWASCEGAASPEECSRYLLVQRGERICGTWSYVASGQIYEGRVIAQASTRTLARRTQICGRPGSETDTECADGWQAIDKPLQLCDGKLSDMAGADGACFADYESVPAAEAERTALETQPWLQACLAADP